MKEMLRLRMAEKKQEALKQALNPNFASLIIILGSRRL